MDRQLLDQFKQELRWLRSRASLFASDQPAAAAHLGISSEGCSDPHTERLLESVALLAAGVQRRIDAACPDVAGCILDAHEPGAGTFTPSLIMAQLVPAPDLPPAGFEISRGTSFKASVRTAPDECILTSCQPVRLFPLAISEITEHQQDVGRLNLPVPTPDALRIVVASTGENPIGDLELDDITFHIIGPSGGAVHAALLAPSARYFVRTDPGRPWEAARAELAPMEASLSTGEFPSRNTWDALARESLALPERFRGVRISELSRACRNSSSTTLEIVVALDRPTRVLTAQGPIDLRLFCTPLGNVYRKRVEIRVGTSPIVVDESRPNRYDIVAFEDVRILDGDRTEIGRFRAGSSRADQLKYHMRRTMRWDGAGVRGASAVYLDIVKGDGSPAHLSGQKLSATTLVTDGEAIAALSGGPQLAVAQSLPVRAVEAVSRLAQASATAIDGPGVWSIAARLNAQPLADGVGGLVEWLRGLDAPDAALASPLAEGIVGLRFRPVRAVSQGSVSHGVEATIQLGHPISMMDGSAVLIAALLDRAIAQRLPRHLFVRTRAILDNSVVANFGDRHGANTIV